MRRILLSCVCAAVVALPAASARAAGHAKPKPGFLVVHKAAGDGGVNGRPVVTVIVRRGFVLGRVSTTREARIDVYHLPSAHCDCAPRVVGSPATSAVRWRGLPGVEYNGTGYRFRAIGGFYRVVVRGAGVYLFAGGKGHVSLRGSSFNPGADGTFSLNGEAPRSLPKHLLKRKFGGG